MYRKKFAALIFAGIFSINSMTFAQSEEDFPEVEEAFQDPNATAEEYPEVDRPFSKNPHSSTINHTEERDKEKISEPVENPPEENIVEEIPAENNPPQVETGDGLEFLMYNENGVQAFAIIAAHEQYKLRPVLAQYQIKGRSTVTKVAADLNDIATINAGYFSADGSLFGITKIDDVIVSSDYFNRSAIGINADDSVIFGRVQYSGKIILNGEEIEINGVNVAREANTLIVYNNRFAYTTGTNNSGIEIIEESGIVTDIQRGHGNNVIPAVGHVISAHGTAAQFFADVRIGDEIIFEENIYSEDADFNSAVHVLGAGPRLIQDGRISVTAAEENFPADIRVGRAPRSAVGVTRYGDYIFAVVDGRQAHSKGCTLEEWADILLNRFGAFNAINLDGGGSTELVVKDFLVNSPSDGRERAVGSLLTILPK